jgi:DNA polymerase-2
MPDTVVDAFVLTREWRDTSRGAQLVLWCWSRDGAVRVRINDARPVCFIARSTKLPPGWRCSRKEVELRSPLGEPVDALYFDSQRALNQARERSERERVQLFESDVRAADRHLMERFIRGGVRITGNATQRGNTLAFDDPRLKATDVEPALRVVSLDIETDGFEGALYSIALAMPGHESVLMRSDRAVHDDDVPIKVFADERMLLEGFLTWLDEHDPDVVLGWNLIGFDLQALERRFAAVGLPYAIGRDRETARVLPGSRAGLPAIALVPGRVSIDGIESLRAAFYNFEDFSLEAVGRDLLGRGKLIEPTSDKLGAIRSLYADDRPALARYNIEDCRLVAEIAEHTDLIGLSVQRTRLTGLALGRLGGSVASLDNLYLPALHRKGFVAYDIGEGSGSGEGSPGGHVLDSKPGLYTNVALLDFKSLYPSLIRTFKIDPYGLWDQGEQTIEGFLGARFRRDGAILPSLIDELWAARDEAKRQHNASLSHAIKIIMNSFYGVLGSSGCRFFDPRLASSITRRGHEVLQRSQALIESFGHTVIYGDTDSLFVLLPESLTVTEAHARGNELAETLNTWWQKTIVAEHDVPSCLEVEFETLYARFLMPTLRGSETGSKKRYAGVAVTPEGVESAVFKGLESVRTDWTLAARRFQRELYSKVFANEPVEDYVREVLAALLRGDLDEQLVYRKRLRRQTDEYRSAIPPQVQAARLAGQKSGWVRYVITREGPRVADGNTLPLDYDHYRERQLAPVADGILHFLETSFLSLTDRQLAIF